MSSIRKTLLIGLTGGLLTGILAVGAAVYVSVHDEGGELFDARLQAIAASIPAMTQAGVAVAKEAADEDEDEISVQVWNNTGRLIYRSSPQDDLPRTNGNGFGEVVTRRGEYRVYNRSFRGGSIQVAQPNAARRELAAQMAARAVAPLLGLLPVMALFIWLMIGRGLRPLSRVANAVAEKNADSMSPLESGAVPVEIRPLVVALNGLLTRLRLAMEQQRVFVGDAAHELRTPLTAVQIQAQLAERANTPEDRQVAFTNLRGGLKRSIHLVAQLLDFARQESGDTIRPPVRVDLSQTVAQSIDALAPLARSKSITIKLERLEPVMLIGDPHGLSTLVGNLVDNAIRYTPAGGHIAVNVTDDSGDAVLEVVDTGPGIKVEDRQRVFDRFYRPDGQGQSGSGLGLAIVKRIADRHDADIQLLDSDHPPGLRVRVRFRRSL